MFVNFYRFLAKPFVSFFIILGISANQVTFLGFLLSFFTAYLIGVDRLYCAAFIYLLMLILDHADGELARKLGNASNRGAFFDSISDRFRTPIVFAGIWYFSEAKEINELLVFISCSIILLNEIFTLVARDHEEVQARPVLIKLFCYDLLGWVNNSILFLFALLTGAIFEYLFFLCAYGILHLIVKTVVKFQFIKY